MLCEHWNYKRNSKCPHKAVAYIEFQYAVWLGGPNPEFKPSQTKWHMCNGHMAAAMYWLHKNGDSGYIPNSIVKDVASLKPHK